MDRELTGVEEWLGEPLQLRSVVPVQREVANDEGGRTVISSVEIWNTMLVVRWVLVAPRRRPRSSSECLNVWRCDDDAGTTYCVSSVV